MKNEIGVKEGLGKLLIRPVYLVSCGHDQKKNLGFDLEHISHEELETVISQNTLSKEQLLLIGETRFGLSRGTLRKSKKKDVQGQIISAIQNIETLDAIKRKAGE